MTEGPIEIDEYFFDVVERWVENMWMVTVATKDARAFPHEAARTNAAAIDRIVADLGKWEDASEVVGSLLGRPPQETPLRPSLIEARPYPTGPPATNLFHIILDLKDPSVKDGPLRDPTVWREALNGVRKWRNLKGLASEIGITRQP